MGRLASANRLVIARPVAELFFPQRPALGLEQRNHSPAVVDKIVSANAEHKSAGKAQKMLWKLAEIKVSIPLIMDLTDVIGQELKDELQQQATAQASETLARQFVEAPNLAVVSVDGGRIMTRADASRGVHDPAWKETKNSCLMTMSSTPTEQDPHPHLPRCFTDRIYVAQLVQEMHTATTSTLPKTAQSPTISRETTDPSGQSNPRETIPETRPSTQRTKEDWRPKRLVRTCVSSMVCSDDFGPLVAGEAQRRGFYDAVRRAFLGDGQFWNWTIHECYFSSFVAITDFVHPLGYIYEVAKVLAPDDSWAFYLRATSDCWQGRVAELIRQLRVWQEAHPIHEEYKLPDDEPRSIVQRTITYLEHNQSRMDYPTYRREGLPISTSMMESLIKELNYRVKGTEKFWNRPDGAEHILQVRAAALCDDDRLSQWILSRRGSAFYRTSTDKKHQAANAA